MSQIKFVIIDVDGTLLASNQKILPATKAALMECQENGIRLILASGRPTSGMARLVAELEMDKHHGLLVAYNGSKVIDCQTGEVLFNRPMSESDAKAVLEHLKQFEVYPMVTKGSYLNVNNVYAPPIKYGDVEANIIEYEARGGGYLLCEYPDLAEFVDFEPNKILVAGQPDYLAQYHEEMTAPFTDRVHGMFSAPFYFEYTARGVDKAKALDTVLHKLGCNRDNLMAIGDGHNDISMLQYAGIGVAMGNAVPELKEIADYVTTSNDDNGVAKALRHFLPECFGV